MNTYEANFTSGPEGWNAERETSRKGREEERERLRREKEEERERLRRERESARAESKRGQKFDPEFEEMRRRAAERAGGFDSPHYPEELQKVFNEWQRKKDEEHKKQMDDLLRDFARKSQEIQDAARRQREGGGGASTGHRQRQEQPPQGSRREPPKQEPRKPEGRRPTFFTRQAGQDFGLTENELGSIFGRIENIPTITLREILMRVFGATSPEDIKSAHRAAALKYHPDQNEGNGINKILAAEKMKIINRLMGEFEKRNRSRP